LSRYIIENKEEYYRRPEQIIEMIFLQPYTKVFHLTSKGLCAENTARNYLNKPSEMGILEKRIINEHL